MIAVFGASGFIGSRLFEVWSAQGKCAFGTAARRSVPGLIRFDLGDPSLPRMVRVTHAVLCSAWGSIDQIERDPLSARKINVTGTMALIEQLQALGIRPVFLSTDHVFDGESGEYREDDPRRALHQYGRMKIEVEDLLLGSGGEFLIVRLSKVYGTKRRDGSMLDALVRSLEQGETVQAAVDQRFNPTAVDDVVVCLDALIAGGVSGVFHLAAPAALTRFEQADLVRRRLGLPEERVRPVRLDDLPLVARRPRDTSLDTRKLQAVVGRTFLSLAEGLERYLAPSEHVDR